MAPASKVCPSPDDLVAMAAGQSSLAERAAVEQHLDECSSCRQLYAALLRDSRTVAPDEISRAESTVKLNPGTRPLSASASGAFGVGQRLGRYVVESEVGAGGMGVVLLARDPDLARKVVIKVLRGDAVQTMGSQQAARARLQREAQAMARLSHPNVVPVFDVGTIDGQIFIAMEYVEGCTLRDWLDQSPRSVAEILSVFHQAGLGLQAAHDAGIVHRDFKPSNVLVGKKGHIKVTDFGLARGALGAPTSPQARLSRQFAAADESALLGSQLTLTGAFVGTPAYTAPEQVLGDFVDHRSDQFSFCVALYEALHGARPFQGNTIEAILDSILSGKRQVGPRSPQVPAELSAALDRGLAAEPSQRFASMSEILQRLAPRVPQGQKWLVGGALALAGAAAIASLMLAQQSQDPSLGCSDGAERIASAWDADKGEQLLERFPGDDRALRLRGRLDDYVTAWSQSYARACRASQEDPDAQSPRDRLACLEQHGDALSRLGGERLAEADLAELIADSSMLPAIRECDDDKTARQATERKQPTQAPAQLEKIDEALGRYDEQEARSLLAALDAEIQRGKHLELASERHRLEGELHLQSERWQEAEKSGQRALQAAEQHGDARARTRAYLLLLHSRLPPYELEEASRWLAVAEAGQGTLDLDDPLRDEIAYARAVWTEATDVPAARALYESLHAKTGTERLLRARVSLDLAALTAAGGELHRSREYALSVIEIVPEVHTLSMRARGHLAELERISGKTSEAVAAQRSLLQQALTIFAAKSPPITIQRLLLSRALHSTGDRPEAVAEAETASEEARERSGYGSLLRAQADLVDGRLRSAMGDRDGAVIAFARAATDLSQNARMYHPDAILPALVAAESARMVNAERGGSYFSQAALVGRKMEDDRQHASFLGSYGEGISALHADSYPSFARIAFEQAVDAAANLGLDPALQARALAGQAAALWREGKKQPALEALARALASSPSPELAEELREWQRRGGAPPPLPWPGWLPAVDTSSLDSFYIGRLHAPMFPNLVSKPKANP